MKRIFTLLNLLVVGTVAFAQTTYYTEGFDDGLPTDWTIEDDWVIDTPANAESQYFPIPDADGNIACFNDDGQGQEGTGEGALTSAMIDLTEVTGDLVLEMNNYFPNLDYQGADETAIINISTNGTDFTELLDLTGGENGAWGVAFTDLSSYAGMTIWLQFVYQDGGEWNYGWGIDNVTISDAVTLIPTRSYAVSAGGATMIDEIADGTEYNHKGYIFNNGFETITSYDLVYSNGTDDFTVNVTGADIPYNTYASYNATQAITATGDQTWTVTLSNVNGSMEEDDDTSNDSGSFNLNAVTGLNADKAVVVEEATGTWCQWCPRGTVFLDEMSVRFPDNFVGIAVHNGDPMALAAYDSAIGSFPGFEGYPSVVFERESLLDPGDIVAPSLAAMQEAPVAGITVGAELNGTTLTTSAEVTFLEAVTGINYSVAIVAVEDGLSGTDAAWSQVNSYAGGGNGEMGGFEMLPGSVPGLTYDHVGIGLIGGYDGYNDLTGSYPVGVTDGNGHIFADWTIPTGSNMDNIHLVGLILNGDGEIVNAKSVSIDEAVNNGLTTVGVEELETVSSLTVFPNPVVENTNIRMNITEASNVIVTVTNALGQVVANTNHGTLNGTVQLDVDMSALTNGIYNVQVQVGSDNFTHKVTKAN